MALDSLGPLQSIVYGHMGFCHAPSLAMYFQASLYIGDGYIKTL